METYIWSLPTRISHWLLFLALIIAYFLGGEEEYINLHAMLGYLAGILILLRFIWGIIGPRYSRFKDFPIGIGKMMEFMTNMKAAKLKYPGHNPLASLIMIAIMIAVIMVVLTGMANLAGEGQGILAIMNLNWESELFEEAHEAMVNVLIALVIFHLIGITVDTIFHGEARTLASIFTGYKKMQGEPVKLSGFQKVYGVIWIAGALSIFAYLFTTQDIKLSGSEKNNREMQESAEGEEDDE